jgi:hypothetical protein
VINSTGSVASQTFNGGVNAAVRALRLDDQTSTVYIAGDFTIAQKVYDRLRDPYGLLDESEEDLFSKELLMSKYARSVVPISAEGSSGGEGELQNNGGFAKPPKWSTALRVT